MNYEWITKSDGNPCEWTSFIIDHVMWWHMWQQSKHEGKKRCEKRGRWLGAVSAWTHHHQGTWTHPYVQGLKNNPTSHYSSLSLG